MTCSKCNTENPAEYSFCLNCGQALPSGGQSPLRETPDDQAHDPLPENGGEQDTVVVTYDADTLTDTAQALYDLYGRLLREEHAVYQFTNGQVSGMLSVYGGSVKFKPRFLSSKAGKKEEHTIPMKGINKAESAGDNLRLTDRHGKVYVYILPAKRHAAKLAALITKQMKKAPDGLPQTQR